MDEHDPLDEQLIDALRFDEPVDVTAAFSEVVGRGRRRRMQHRLALSFIVTVIVVTIAGAAVAVNGNSADRVRVQGADATTTSSSPETSTSTADTNTTLSTYPPILPPDVPGTTTVAPPDGGSTTTTTASPWPPGTVLEPRNLTAIVTFDPPAAISRSSVGFTATITNPDDNWTFTDFAKPNDVYMIGLTIGINANWYYTVALSTDTVFQHQTSQGQMTGLLLAPHASQTFTGHFVLDGAIGFDRPNPDGTRDYPAVISFVEGGHAGVCGSCGMLAGSLIILPQASTTTDTTPP